MLSLCKLNIPLLWARFSSSSFLRFLKAAPDGLDCLFILKVLQMFANYSTTTSIYHQKEPLGCSAHLPLTRLVNKTACRCNVHNCPACRIVRKQHTLLLFYLNFMIEIVYEAEIPHAWRGIITLWFVVEKISLSSHIIGYLIRYMWGWQTQHIQPINALSFF